MSRQDAAKPHEVHAHVLEAEQRIRPYIRTTPLDDSVHLGRLAGCKAFLKLENQQVTGSFKYRGVLNRLLSLSDRDLHRGVVTASSGNHGIAFARALATVGGRGCVYVPSTVAPGKLAELRSHGVDVVLGPADVADTEMAARAAAQERGLLFISPYNDEAIIAGQGTVAHEILRQLPELDSVFVPVGGGGLISGIASYLKTERPDVTIWGCQPLASPVMAESIRAGRIVAYDSRPTLADGTAGGIEPGSVTFAICRQVVDGFVLLDEEEIASAILAMVEHHHMIIEGAAALAVAGLLKRRDALEGTSAVAVVSGARLGVDDLRRVLCT
jgi:threonine dehydratase